MDVARLIEDLEASVHPESFQVGAPREAFEQCASASITLGNRVVRLQRLVFASDFLLGQCESRTFAINYDCLGELRLHAGGQVASKNSKTKLHQWVRELPSGLRFSLTLANGHRICGANVLSCDKTLIILRQAEGEFDSSAVPLSAVSYLEFNAVDNKPGL